MSAALPIVATEEIGAVADLVDSENGFQISQWRLIDETTEALSSLLESKALREKMGDASLKKIQNWSFESTENGLIEALNNCQ
jgi:glycosyltransferase involved in cell wall biosynthesis